VSESRFHRLVLHHWRVLGLGLGGGVCGIVGAELDEGCEEIWEDALEE